MDNKTLEHIARTGSVLVEYPCTECTDGYQPVQGLCLECGKSYQTPEDFKLLVDSGVLPCCGSDFSKYHETQPLCPECEGTKVIHSRLSMKELVWIIGQHFVSRRFYSKERVYP